MIGGLRSKTTVETVKGIPGLMNVKYLGALFRTHETDVRESELLVFIMPEIVGYQGGLDREMQALCVAQHQLSRISPAVDGPCSPDCRDKHCPHHYPRPRPHNGMQDDGLVGAQAYGLIGIHDAEFGTPGLPSPPATQLPLPTTPQMPAIPTQPSEVVTPNSPSGFILPAPQFDTSIPSIPVRPAVSNSLERSLPTAQNGVQASLTSSRQVGKR